MRKKYVRRFILVGVILVSGLLGGCSSCSRMSKSISSDMGGGLNRTVTLYSYNGDEMKSWTGKFDVSESDNEVYFDLNGKRIIIHGGIVINEEN
jgi:outer membrane murein-binding lipoprotein Lpp